ncbi:hypothetical protein HMPREF1573_01187 [Gardnerella vaginalis JCP7276]|nr:hypothetical protein HMPREF1575_00622 [Gardnerella vaginalis JCP7672]EPI55111.1 hypothetical protein HMPREF1573_01187 [Gardnerella vaginalis JCP7276]
MRNNIDNFAFVICLPLTSTRICKFAYANVSFRSVFCFGYFNHPYSIMLLNLQL